MNLEVYKAIIIYDPMCVKYIYFHTYENSLEGYILNVNSSYLCGWIVDDFFVCLSTLLIFLKR